MAYYYHHCGLYCIALFFIIICSTSIHGDRNCSRGLVTPGYTEPYGDIIIEYGDPLHVICVLNQPYVQQYGQNASSNLYFMRNKEAVQSDMIEVLNSSAIRLHIEKPPKSSSLYTCKLRNYDGAVCINTVIVGTKPLPIEDFQCIGYNYENLTCTWTPPENYVKTSYSLSYYFPGRASRFISFSCPNIEATEDGKLSCFWNILSEPQYRQAQRTYHFILNVTNAFGSYQLTKTFSHFQHVLSGPPENLTYLSTTTESIFLRWSIPSSMQTFPPGLQHRIMYQSEYESKDWKLAAIINTESETWKEVTFNLTGLKYAHALYDIRVSMRSNAAAQNDESMWSKNSSLTVWTKSTVPGAAPRTNIGSFEIVSSGNNLIYREVYIYWQQIPEEIKNGEDFRYNVTVVGDIESAIKLEEITKSYAKFKDLSTAVDYEFHVYSQNSEGRSRLHSTVHVPKQKERVKEPKSFTKIAYGNGKYTVLWEHASKSVKNYTIFWCKFDRDRPYQCNGYLNWTEISSVHTSYNVSGLSEDKTHQFAISANTESSSSGMVWAACTVIHNKAIGKMKSVWINHIGSTYIEVGWKLDCTDRIGSAEGFVIYYCPIVSPRETNCKGPQQNLTVYGDPTLVHGNITNLTPYTTYMLTVAVITKHTSQSQQSDPLYNTTLEAAPSSAPFDVHAEKVTNSSITLIWSPPNATNGILKYYKIIYNDTSITVEPKPERKFTIYNLTSYDYYYIRMVACTVACSKPSPMLKIRTQAGYPGKVNQPSIEFQNTTFTKLKWERPYQPGGNVDVYEVKFKEKHNRENRTHSIVNVSDTHYNIEKCGAKEQYNAFYVSVRAVNVIDGVNYPGPWSDELESYCHIPPSMLLYYLASIIGAVVFFSFLAYCLKRVYLYYKKMKNVELKLPPGLQADCRPEWVPQKSRDEILHSSADEELLLRKIREGCRSHSGDSSGCSSGHESVVSSLGSGCNADGVTNHSDSRSHISSTSDSGTEQSRGCPPSIIDEMQSSVRFRRPRSVRNNGSIGGSNGTNMLDNKDYVSAPESFNDTGAVKAKTNGSPGAYCILGVETSLGKGADSTLYLPTPPTTSPFLTWGSDSSLHLPTPPTTRYCDFDEDDGEVESSASTRNVTEESEKNPIYMIAGNTNNGNEYVGSSYVQVSDVVKAAEDPVAWQQSSKGYVTIGTDAAATGPSAEDLRD